MKTSTKDRYFSSRDRLDLAGSFSHERRGRAELREPERAIEVVKRIYSPERRKDRNLIEGDDYAEKAKQVREQLEIARQASQTIQLSHEYLTDELYMFQDKLHRHSMRRDGERVLMTESRGVLGDFHDRLVQVRKSADGRHSPDTLDNVERALEEAWGDFDNVRSVMMGNLKILNDAKEDLLRERMKREEEYDHRKVRELERTLLDIRERELAREAGLRRFPRSSRSGYANGYH